MSAPDAIRRGVANEGGFFSPYYLFDLLGRRHEDELDFEGRERERRALPRVYRRAMAKLEGGGTRRDLWHGWYEDLFTALQLDTQDIADGAETERHGRVPISHAVASPAGGVRVLVDLHPLGTDLDRERYDPRSFGGDGLSQEPIARAFELALDGPTAAELGVRFGLLANGTELRLYRRGGSVARQFLRVDFTALFDADRDDEWTAFWGLFRGQAFEPGEGGRCLVERVLEQSRRHASKIAEDLRDNVVEALEALIQGILDERENARHWGGGRPDEQTLRRLFEESLDFLYRLLFVLYAESRDVLPIASSAAYRDTYSLEQLRTLAERELHPEDAGKTWYHETLLTLFRLLRKGHPGPVFEIPALGGRGPEDADWDTVRTQGDRHMTSLFDGRRTLLLDRCKIPDRTLQAVVAELSLSRPRRRRDRRERYSYADLGVDQLGSVYEGLLVYEPVILDQDMVVAKVKGEERLVPVEVARENEFPIVEGSERLAGSFCLRQWGGRRKGSGSYYTPETITSFLVEEALQERVDAIVARCDAAWKAEKERAAATDKLAMPATHVSEEILEIKVCDPAMGSGAFLIQACRYLADAYGRARIAEGHDESGRLESEERSRYERLVAERCLYGVDLNPLAVELAKVSLWLETLSRGRPLSFLDAHLRCGNSLLSAPLRDERGELSAEGLATIPDEALKLVRDDAAEEEKKRSKALVRRNQEHRRALREQAKAGQSFFAGFGFDDPKLRQILDAYRAARGQLDESDEAKSDREAHRLREEKERRFAEVWLAEGSPAHRLKEVCDLWCSAWFWPEEEGREAFESSLYQDVAARILAGEPIADPPDWLATAREVAKEQRFFHWELEFPEVFLRENPGFDAVVGNPPWEKVSGDVGELAGEYDATLKTLRGDERDARLAEILADPAAGPHLVHQARSRAQYARGARELPPFEGLITGELNTFAPFTALAWRLQRKCGALGLVLKDAFHLAKSQEKLRAEMLATGRIHVLAAADNEKKVFDAHHLLRFDLLVAQRGQSAGIVPISIHRFRTAAEIVEHARDGVEIPLGMLKDDDGRFTEPIPEIQDDLWPALMEKARKTAEGSVPIRWSAELHSSGDKDCWTREEKPAGSRGPVLAMVGAFDALEYEPMAWLRPDAPSQAAFRKVIYGRYRVAVRDRADQKNERVLIGAVVPRESATCHYLNLCREPVEDPRQVLQVAALANSLLLDYLARPFVGIHMGSGILNKLPWLLPAEPDAALVEGAARLTCIRAEFEPLRETLRGITPATSKPGRALLRARLDARIAQLYGLSAHQFARVLAWFRLLDQEQKPLPGEPRSFLTRDLALREFLRLIGEAPPTDLVAFYREAGVDIAEQTGEIRDPDARIAAATELGAVAYQPSRAGRRSDEEQD
jgi:hypothetical protein